MNIEETDIPGYGGTKYSGFIYLFIYRLFVSGEENTFLSFVEGKLDDETFQPPHGVICK